MATQDRGVGGLQFMKSQLDMTEHKHTCTYILHIYIYIFIFNFLTFSGRYRHGIISLMTLLDIKPE